MPPEASGAGGAGAEYHYLDHDTAVFFIAPPVLNQWYNVLTANDVRILSFMFDHINVEVANMDIEVRWTLDGNVYLLTANVASTTNEWVYRTTFQSGTGNELALSAVECAAMLKLLDKRAQSASLDIRITSALGTNQTLEAMCTYETLEPT